MSTPVRVIVNFISRDPKSFVEAATKVRKEGGIEKLFCISAYNSYIHLSSRIIGWGIRFKLQMLCSQEDK